MSNNGKKTVAVVSIEDNSILELIRTQVKNVLRNDKEIRELIEQEISNELKRYVYTALVGLDLKEIAQNIMKSRIEKNIPNARMIAGSTLKAINDKVSEILTADNNALAIALGKEIKPLCNVCQVEEVEKSDPVCSKCRIFFAEELKPEMTAEERGEPWLCACCGTNQVSGALEMCSVCGHEDYGISPIGIHNNE